MAPTEFFISGKFYFRISGVILAAAGIAVVIAGALATHYSGGYYLGGVYSGVLTVFFASSLLQLDVYRSFWSLAGWTLCNLIICIVALGISSANQEFLNSLEACATYSSSLTTSCGSIPAYAECSGNDDYFAEAQLCEANYVADNDGTIEDNQCSCVTNDDSDTCYNYYHILSCSDFLRLVPGQVGAAISFLTIILIANLFVMVLVVINRCKPEMIRSRQEQNEISEHAAPIVTNVAVASPIAASAVVVQVHGAVPANKVEGNASGNNV